MTKNYQKIYGFRLFIWWFIFLTHFYSFTTALYASLILNINFQSSPFLLSLNLHFKIPIAIYYALANFLAAVVNQYSTNFFSFSRNHSRFAGHFVDGRNNRRCFMDNFNGFAVALVFSRIDLHKR